MSRVKCEQRGGKHPSGAGKDNAPFDEKAWRKTYMKRYMAELRARKRRQAAEPKDNAP